jgi:predicted O-methyltransferase YrrM
LTLDLVISCKGRGCNEPCRIEFSVNATTNEPAAIECRMTLATWTAVDDYVAVSAPLGKVLHRLARIHGARRILEIGTLGGYSTIWLARALPSGGRLVSLEFDPRHAEVARKNLAHAGVADKVDVRIGRALDLLPALEADERFDLVFIDADKPSTPEYFRWATTLTREGGVIVVDNVVRDGKVIDESGSDESVDAMRRFLAALAADPHASGTVIQTVGAKGYDGFALVLK